MNFWLAVAGWVVATLVVMGALSINGATEPPAGGHGHGHDDDGHGAQAHGGGHH